MGAGDKVPQSARARGAPSLECARRAGVAALFFCFCACGSEEPKPEHTGGSGGFASTPGGTGNGGTNVQGNGGSTEGGLAHAGGSGAPGTGGLSNNAGGSGGSGGSGGGAGSFTLTSPALDNVMGCSVETANVCDAFPDENGSYMDNANVSPELHWTGVPPGTQSFALVLFDVTYGQAHWALWNIPADATMLAADVAKDTATPPIPAGSRQANANFATTEGEGYFGPHMPCNVFELQLYALSLSMFSPMEPESSVLVSIELQDLGQPVLGVARLAGRGNDSMMPCE